MTPSDRDSLVQAWLTYQRNWWAYESLMKLWRESPSEALEVIGRLIELADDDEMIGDIGAGPLEDLIREHASRVVDDLAIRADSDARFCQALSHVWFSEEDVAVRERLIALGCQQIEPTK